jgi:hypothetical protein
MWTDQTGRRRHDDEEYNEKDSEPHDYHRAKPIPAPKKKTASKKKAKKKV